MAKKKSYRKKATQKKTRTTRRGGINKKKAAIRKDLAIELGMAELNKMKTPTKTGKRKVAKKIAKIKSEIRKLI